MSGDRQHAITIGRLLEPLDRDSEFLSGLISALTFTCTLSVAYAGVGKGSTVALSALACNFAWGVVDGVMYLLSRFAQRSSSLVALRRLGSATSPEAVREVAEHALPDSVVAVLSPQELDALRARITNRPLPDAGARLRTTDVLAALAIVAVVVLAAVPVVLPLAVIDDATVAARVSNATAIVLLFHFGRAVGRATGTPPLRTGIAMVAIGIALVAIAIALGG